MARLIIGLVAAVSFVLSGAGQAEQREARLLQAPLGERPATLASCNQGQFKHCLDAAAAACKALNSGTSCPNPEPQCRASSGC